jgi:hypothetical protein
MARPIATREEFVMRTALVLLATFALAACQPERTPPDPIAGSAATEVAPDPGEQPAGSQYDPVNRANAVEGDVLEQKESQDAAIEAQGG